MNIADEVKLDYADVLIVPQRSRLSSRSEVKLEREYVFPHSSIKLNCVGIIAANMDTVGTMEMAKAFKEYKMLVALHKYYTEEELLEFFKEKTYWETAFYTVGTSSEDEEKLESLVSQIKSIHPNEIFPTLLCIDIANGYSQHFIDKLKFYREKYPESVIMAGNVCTPNMAEELIMSGADLIKIGIGPGAACTTRVKTGVGYPQLSATAECSHATHGLRGHVCADGGVTCPGDVSKAFAAGADFVMMGAMFAGTDECEGECEIKLNENIPLCLKETYNLIKSCESNIDADQDSAFRLHLPEEDNDFPKSLLNDDTIFYSEDEIGFQIVDIIDNKAFIKLIEDNFCTKTIKYYGMSSEEAQKKHNGGLSAHRAAEGKVVHIPYKGSVNLVIQDILGGVRSTCTYVGAEKIKDLPKCAQFIRVNKTHNTLFGDNWQQT